MQSKVSKWRWVLRGGTGLLGLLVVALVSAVVTSRVRMGKHYSVPVPARSVPVASGEAALREGKRLFISRGCADCHGQNGAGRVVMDAPPGLIVGTSLVEYARSAKPGDFVRAIRSGVGRDGRPLVFMPSHELRQMNDEELSRLIAYTYSLPYVPSQLPQTKVRPLGNVLHTLGLFPLLPAELIDHTQPLDDFPAREVSVAYGKSLAVGCTGCHGESLSGGPIPGAPPELGMPANLTPHPSGLAAWSQADFVRTMREGVDPKGHRLDPKQMPWPAFAQMNDTELGALFAYLRTVPAKPAGGR